MTVKAKPLPSRMMEPVVSQSPPRSDAQAPPATEETREGAGSPIKFALCWFGIPLALVLLSVVIRMQCGMGS